MKNNVGFYFNGKTYFWTKFLRRIEFCLILFLLKLFVSYFEKDDRDTRPQSSRVVTIFIMDVKWLFVKLKTRLLDIRNLTLRQATKYFVCGQKAMIRMTFERTFT